MKTLVLCVDRDNDLGEKARVRSPIIGRAKKNIEGATKLAIVDPEDSDVNAIFAGVKVYDELQAAGHEVEIATICGGKEVNELTDMILSNQLETTLHFTGVNSVLLITDGAEDEHIMPLIQSRAKISGIRRVIVRQEHNIEGFYYYITKALEDEKMRKITIPLAMVLVILGLSYLTDYAHLGWAFVITLLGVYLLVKGLHWEKTLQTVYEGSIASVKNFKISLITTLVAFLVAIAGVVTAFDAMEEAEKELKADDEEFNIADRVLLFVEVAIWWLIAAGIILALGTVVDEWQAERKLALDNVNYLPYLIAVGMIITASVDTIQRLTEYDTADNITIFTWLVLGVFTLIVGRFVKNFINEYFPARTAPAEARGWRK